ncbi:hypothetical protein NDI39_22240 [Microcoleus sp. ZQ-A2]|nr:hypothetical protein [Microcoleus sp. FACHB-1]
MKIKPSHENQCRVTIHRKGKPEIIRGQKEEGRRQKAEGRRQKAFMNAFDMESATIQELSV